MNNSDLLYSLKSTTTSSSFLHIPIRFTLINRLTSFGHCLCSSFSIDNDISSSISYPKIIHHQSIDQILSTCSLISQTTIFSPCLSSSPISETSNSISVVNLLTPPLSHSSSSSSFFIENIIPSDNRSIIDEITSQFGEICPPLPKKRRNRSTKKLTSILDHHLPLDLSFKKRPSSFDFISSIKT